MDVLTGRLKGHKLETAAGSVTLEHGLADPPKGLVTVSGTLVERSSPVAYREVARELVMKAVTITACESGRPSRWPRPDMSYVYVYFLVVLASTTCVCPILPSADAFSLSVATGTTLIVLLLATGWELRHGISVVSEKGPSRSGRTSVARTTVVQIIGMMLAFAALMAADGNSLSFYPSVIVLALHAVVLTVIERPTRRALLSLVTARRAVLVRASEVLEVREEISVIGKRGRTKRVGPPKVSAPRLRVLLDGELVDLEQERWLTRSRSYSNLEGFRQWAEPGTSLLVSRDGKLAFFARPGENPRSELAREIEKFVLLVGIAWFLVVVGGYAALRVSF